MGWGIWKKIKNFFGKVGNGIKKAAKKVGNFFKPVVKTGLDVVSKAGTLIGGAVGSAYGNPKAGVQIGSIAQNLAGGLNQAIK